jgi:dihydrofolate reductase
MTLFIIAAVDLQGAIGYRQQLLTHLPDDLKYFKKMTFGYTIIMGRKTFQSLPGGALPARNNIVISSQTDLHCPDCLLYHSWEEALNASAHYDKVFVIGGASLYQQALPHAHFLLLTRIDHTFEHADTFFPPFSLDDWLLIQHIPHPADINHPFSFSFLTYRRE